MVAYNAVDFGKLLSKECYSSIVISSISFTLLFIAVYYCIGSRIINKNYNHVNQTPKLYWKIIDSSISMIHGIIIISLIIAFEKNLSVFNINQSVIDTLTTKYEIMIASISIGYFLYDIVFSCFIFSKKHTGKYDYVYLGHHILSIVGMVVIIITVHSGFLIIIALFCNEITNPLLHINNIRNKLIDRNKPISKNTLLTDFIIKLLYVIGFAIARFIILGILFYKAIFIYECSDIIITYGLIAEIGCIYLFIALIRDLTKTWSNYSKNKNSVRYSQVTEITETEQEEFDTECDDGGNDTDKLQKYQDILALSKKSVTQFFMAGVVYSFFHTNRMSIYVLYAHEFNPSSLEIAFLLYGSNFWNGIAAILYGAMANHYGYDKLLVMLLCLQCIAVLLESLAQSYYMLLLGIILGQVAITYIVMGYIAWALPHKYATTYTSYFYAAFVGSYLIGPLSAGFVSFYVSNRTVFIINFILCLCALFHGIIFIYKTQKNIESKQLTIGLMEEMDENEQFPICVEQNKISEGNMVRIQENEDEEEENQGNNIIATDNGHNEKWYKLPKLSMYEWIMLISIILINTTVSIGEVNFIVYYSIYVIEDMNGNVIKGTVGLLLMSLSFMIGNLIVPKWFGDGESSNIIRNKYFVLCISLISMMIHMFYLYPTVTILNIYWILNITSGIPHGIISMTSEILILEIQPTKASGKISGSKGLIRNWLMAIILLIISINWDNNHKIFYYATAISFTVALSLTILMFGLDSKYNHKQNDNNDKHANAISSPSSST